MSVIQILICFLLCLFYTESSQAITKSKLDLKLKIKLINCQKLNSENTEKLQRFAQDSVTKGLKCLDQYSLHKELNDLYNLLFKKEYNIVCKESLNDNMAIAINEKNAPHYPGIEIDVSDFFDQSPQSTIFHETIHLLSYNHFNGFDIAYITQFCCFDNPAQSDSCEILKSKPIWTSETYIKKLTTILSKNDLEKVAIRTAWEASQKNNFKLNSLINIAAKQVLNSKQEKGHPNKTLASVFQMASCQLNRIECENKDYFVSEYSNTKLDSMLNKKVALFKLSSELVKGILNNNPSEIDLKWSQISALGPTICDQLEISLKKQLRSIVEITATSIFDMKPRPADKASVGWWELCKPKNAWQN